MMSSIMGVSANTGKEMLAEFKRTRKSKVHACYAICGYLKQANNESNSEQEFVISIVKEENFATRKADFDRITSLHIYSVEPNTVTDVSSTVWLAENSKFKALLGQETPESENYLK